MFICVPFGKACAYICGSKKTVLHRGEKPLYKDNFPASKVKSRKLICLVVERVSRFAIVQHHLLPLAPILYDLLERAKQESYRRALQAAEAYLLFPSDDFARQADIFGQDPFPSGVAANRRMLELLSEELLLEGQIETPPALEDAFAEQG